MPSQTLSSVSPRSWMLLFLVIAMVCMTLSTTLSLQEKVVGQQFATSGEKLVLLQDNGEDGIAITALGSTPEQLVPVNASAILEEPDVLETYQEYNHFLEQQTRISQALSGNTLWLESDNDTLQTLELRQRQFKDLRFGFYLQQISGLVCLLIGGAIWAFNIHRIESRFYLLMGSGVALSCWSSAVYTSRELAISGELFRQLSLVNHFGAAAFGGGLVGLFTVYPRALASPGRAWLLASTFLAVWLADSLQLTQSIAMAFHIPLLVYVLLTFMLGIIQWRKTANHPADRAILKWLILSAIGTSMIFTTMNIIPAAFMSRSLGSQAFTLTGFSLGFLIMALGLSRYKLFNLDRWWLQYWTWFFAGIAVLLLDWILLALLHLNHGLALGIAVAVVGWAYIPVRHAVWKWLTPDSEKSLETFMPDIVKTLFATRNKEEMHAAWGVILQEIFQPLNCRTIPEQDSVQLAEHGQGMRVPSLPGEPGWELLYAVNGSRLFSRQDIELAEMILALMGKAMHAMQAREQGVLEERNRIKRDIHDDLGARLLAVIHGDSLEQSQWQARQAMIELRSILNALEQTHCPLQEAFSIWQAELEERILRAGFTLEWEQHFSSNPAINARARHNLGRILRELASNSLKHSGGDCIHVTASCDGKQLDLTFSDNGKGINSERQQGLGKKIVQSRIEELGGSVSWQSVSGQGYTTTIRLQL